MSSRNDAAGTSAEPDALALLPCTACEAKCCKYVAVQIDRPTCKRDYDQIRWYLLHKRIQVFVDHDGDWHLEFATECDALQRDFMCGVYETRPQICRDHGWPVGTCEHFADPYRHVWTTASAFEDWLDAEGIDWRWKRRPRSRVSDE